jgi:hypothetical protein
MWFVILKVKHKQLDSLACYVMRYCMGCVGTVVLLGETRAAHRIFVGKLFLCGQMEVTEHGKVTL